ncbi:MAG: hypothetical protein WKF77_26055 [Planctomycetaceae bacterium]
MAKPTNWASRDRRLNHFDYHATLMYLFGLSSEQLSIVRPTGINSLLDGQPGEVVAKILQRPPEVVK